MAEYTAPLIALAGTIFGGAGLEITRRWLDRAKDRSDAGKQLRDELRGDVTSYRSEIASLKEEVDKVEKELEEWRAKYYDLYGKYLTLQGLHEEALRQIQSKATKTIAESQRAVDLTPPDPPDTIATSNPTE